MLTPNYINSKGDIYAAQLSSKRRAKVMNQLEAIHKNPNIENKYRVNASRLRSKIRRADKNYKVFEGHLDIPENSKFKSVVLPGDAIEIIKTAQSGTREWAGKVVLPDDKNKIPLRVNIKRFGRKRSYINYFDTDEVQFHTHPTDASFIADAFEYNETPYFHKTLKKIEDLPVNTKESKQKAKIEDLLYNQSNRTPSGTDFQTANEIRTNLLLIDDKNLTVINPLPEIQVDHEKPFVSKKKFLSEEESLSHGKRILEYAALKSELGNFKDLDDLEWKAKQFVDFNHQAEAGYAANYGLDLQIYPLSKRKEDIEFDLFSENYRRGNPYFEKTNDYEMGKIKMGAKKTKPKQQVNNLKNSKKNTTKSKNKDTNNNKNQDQKQKIKRDIHGDKKTKRGKDSRRRKGSNETKGRIYKSGRSDKEIGSRNIKRNEGEKQGTIPKVFRSIRKVFQSKI
jgi:hypothetical protein